MIEIADVNGECFHTTDGDIAIINLNSARRQSWSRFYHDPQRAGIAETVLEHELLTAQFVGDLSALDRLESLAEQLGRVDVSSTRTALIQAQVASTMHRFSDARHYIAQADLGGAPSADTKRLLLNVDQACGVNLAAVLKERHDLVRKSGGRLEDRVALGALQADMREFEDADQTYREALREYRDVSPFAVAWVCFQLGVLWGELVPEPQLARAETWYRKAIACLPGYIRARVHLAEIYSGSGRTSDAEATLAPAVASGDPEALWRLADALALAGRLDESDARLRAARSGFEALLDKHLLAFADHGAEFYASSGSDVARALELARVNVANRPTLRAFEQAYRIAAEARDREIATEILAAASTRWGDSAAFRLSSLAHHSDNQEGAAAANHPPRPHAMQ
jgi:hypothetical protein